MEFRQFQDPIGLKSYCGQLPPDGSWASPMSSPEAASPPTLQHRGPSPSPHHHQMVQVTNIHEKYSAWDFFPIHQRLPTPMTKLPGHLAEQAALTVTNVPWMHPEHHLPREEALSQYPPSYCSPSSIPSSWHHDPRGYFVHAISNSESRQFKPWTNQLSTVNVSNSRPRFSIRESGQTNGRAKPASGLSQSCQAKEEESLNEFHQPAEPTTTTTPSSTFSLSSTKKPRHQGARSTIIRQASFQCPEPSCRARFTRPEVLKRHMKCHLAVKPHVCWVPGCGKAFSRNDNLTAHYRKTHARKGGRNRYVATLDWTSGWYDPGYRGELTEDGMPVF